MTIAQLETYYKTRMYQCYNLNLALMHFDIGNSQFSWDHLMEWGLLMHEADEMIMSDGVNTAILASRGRL